MSPELEAVAVEFERAEHRDVWRISPATRVFDFPDWDFVGHDPRTGNRWDDPEGRFRTLYFGDSPLACFVEVLACFRPDWTLFAALDAIVDDVEDPAPLPVPGLVPREWIESRSIGHALLDGWFVVVSHSRTIGALRPHVLGLARRIGFEDFDGASLRAHAPRELTQTIAGLIHGLPSPDGALTDGLRFFSRHGDDLGLWAVFEYTEMDGRPRTKPQCISSPSQRSIAVADPDFLQAMVILGLHTD